MNNRLMLSLVVIVVLLTSVSRPAMAVVTEITRGAARPPVMQDQSQQTSTTGAFTPTGSMAVARYGAAVVPLIDGSVLVAGGRGSTTDGVRSTEVYSPTTGTWTTKGDMVFARLGHAVVR